MHHCPTCEAQCFCAYGEGAIEECEHPGCLGEPDDDVEELDFGEDYAMPDTLEDEIREDLA